ncbi:FimB/Mfa2 family fimbrial subunit [Bacteroides sp. 224]|uniref:FimB/Mfa2 family fimbrial subunit n=1 Tax=Bacteroides sp. 224 TaxID=2302936 RepID=UPI0013D51023|nr:FimB/Mfa2 family fimbrial subunit [Bacteroides sp. 224]
MRTVFKHTISFLILLLTPLYICGCLGEGDVDCDALLGRQELTLEFKHSINPKVENIIEQIVDSIDLYVYKQSGELLQTERLYAEQLDSTNYTHTLTLTRGTYTIVAWMNSGEEYVMEETTSGFSAATHRILCGGTRHIDHKIQSPVYYAYDNDKNDTKNEDRRVVVTLDGHPKHQVLNFARNTNNIRISTIFDRILPTGTQIEAHITGRNGVCNFSNQFASGCPDYTYSWYNKEVINDYRTVLGKLYYSTHNLDINTQRLWVGDDLNLTITMTDATTRAVTVLINKPLTPLIMQNPAYYDNFQLEIFHDYLLEFVFEKDRNNWAHSEIIVNNWYTVNIEANLDTQK